jgi:hypothetical protein
MEWEPKDASVDINDRPIPLRASQIEEIVNSIPRVRAADPASAQNARNHLMVFLRDELKGKKICPSMIHLLVKETIRQFYKSEIEAGTPVGTLAAESVGASTTQMTLNSFYTSGARRTLGAGFDRLKELINASKNTKFPNTIIYFKNNALSFEQVINMRGPLVGSTAASLIKNGNDAVELELRDRLQTYWWHQTFSMLYPNVRIPASEYVLRIHFNVNELYIHKVTLADIATVLQRAIPPGVVAVYGPTEQGIMDLYPDPQRIGKTLETKKFASTPIAERVYLYSIVLPELARIRIKGIDKIVRLFPARVPVLQAVLEEYPINYRDYVPAEAVTAEMIEYHDTPGRIWALVYDKGRMAVSGITAGNLSYLLEVCGIKVFGDVGGNFMMAGLPEDELLVRVDAQGRRLPNEGTPTRRVERFVEADRKARIIAESEQLEAIRKQNEAIDLENRDNQRLNLPLKAKLRPGLIVLQLTPVERASRIIIAETDGSNLNGILSHPDVDATRTYSNSLYETYQVLGIEAARNILVKELFDTVTNAESYINPHHFSLIADSITGRGLPLGATFFGISRQPGGYFSQAMVERGADVMSKAALVGKSEEITGISIAVATGQKPATGTGGPFDIRLDPATMAEIEAQVAAAALEPEIESPYTEADMNQALQRLETEGVVARNIQVPSGIEANISDIEASGGRVQALPTTRAGIRLAEGLGPVPPVQSRPAPALPQQILAIRDQLRLGIGQAPLPERNIISPLTAGVPQAGLFTQIYNSPAPITEIPQVGTGLPEELLELMGLTDIDELIGGPTIQEPVIPIAVPEFLLELPVTELLPGLALPPLNPFLLALPEQLTAPPVTPLAAAEDTLDLEAFLQATQPGFGP